MRTFTASTTAAAGPGAVLDVLTAPEAARQAATGRIVREATAA